MGGDEPNSIERLLTQWEEQLAWKEKAHIETSRWGAVKNSWIGYPAAALSAIVGTSIFASFLAAGQGGTVAPWIQVGAVVLSLSAAALSTIQAQTSSEFLDRAEQHRSSAARYGNLR